MANEGICLDSLDTPKMAAKNATIARIVNCAETSRQIWSYDFQTQLIVHRKSGSCLTASADITNAFSASNGDTITMHSGNKESRFNVSTMPCMANQRQKWMLLPFAWK